MRPSLKLVEEGKSGSFNEVRTLAEGLQKLPSVRIMAGICVSKEASSDREGSGESIAEILGCRMD
jgi:hypothetical protein